MKNTAKEPSHPISEICSSLLTSKDKKISLLKIFSIFHGKGRYALLLILSLPFCLPIQIPGMSTPFGLAIAFLGLRIAFGRRLWLPQYMLNKTIRLTTLHKIIKKYMLFSKKTKKWIKPRWERFLTYPFASIINGLLLTLLGLLLALPLPIPFSNLIVAWAILAICLGIVHDDGLVLMIGYGISCLALITFGYISWSFQHIL